MANEHEVLDMVPVRGDQLPTVNEIATSAEAHLAAMEWRQKIIEQRVPAILAQTSPRHWVDYGGESDPRPEDEAAVIFATMLGVSYEWLPQPNGLKYTERPIEGKPGHFDVLVDIRGSAFGRSVETTGSASSDDPLLSRGKRARNGKAQFADVLKKAEANALVRLLQALGMRGITWEDLDKAGIARDKCHSVQFAESQEVAAKKATRAKTSRPCPKCAETPCEKCKEGGGKAMLTLRAGKRGHFLGCSHYPACGYTEDVSEDEPAEEPPAGPVAEGQARARADAEVLIRELATKLEVGSAWLKEQFGHGRLEDLTYEQVQDCLKRLEDMHAEAMGGTPQAGLYNGEPV